MVEMSGSSKFAVWVYMHVLEAVLFCPNSLRNIGCHLFCAPPPLLLASPGVTEALFAPKGDGGWYLGGGWGVWGGHVTPVCTDTP